MIAGYRLLIVLLTAQKTLTLCLPVFWALLSLSYCPASGQMTSIGIVSTIVVYVILLVVSGISLDRMRRIPSWPIQPAIGSLLLGCATAFFMTLFSMALFSCDSSMPALKPRFLATIVLTLVDMLVIAITVDHILGADVCLFLRACLQLIAVSARIISLDVQSRACSRQWRTMPSRRRP